MHLPPLRPAVCLSRRNRFVAMVREGERVYTAHIPSSGRLRELIFPGNELWVAEAEALRDAKQAGVLITACRCEVDSGEIRAVERIPVLLP